MAFKRVEHAVGSRNQSLKLAQVVLSTSRNSFVQLLNSPPMPFLLSRNIDLTIVVGVGAVVFSRAVATVDFTTIAMIWVLI